MLLWTLWETKATARQQLRAYLTVQSKGIIYPVAGEPQVNLQVFNKGQTPAHSISVEFGYTIEKRRSSLTPERCRSEAQGHVGNTYLPPGDDIHLYSEILEISTAEQHSIENKEASLLYFGTINYSDAFNRKQRLRFCYYHEGGNLAKSRAKRTLFWNEAT